jgi:hypothetical protein
VILLDSSNDGLHIIIGMLIVGLVFLAVIGIGEFVHAAAHRRRVRRTRPL